MSKKLYIETYGCQMNVADSEVVASVMQSVRMPRTRSIIVSTLFSPSSVATPTTIPKPGIPSRSSACWAVWPSA